MTLLLDSALGAAVILAAGWAATIALRTASADLRRAVWRATIGAVAVLPLLYASAVSDALPAAFSAAAIPSTAGVVTTSGSPISWSFGIWSVGCLAVLSRLAAGVRHVRRWSHDAEADGGLRYSADVAVPMTWGVIRPEILLPRDAREWPLEERALVIRHEEAHVEHHDWAWQTFSRLVAAVFWFHPLIWIADRGLRREAERAADDRVLALGASATDYAAELVKVARGVQARPVAAVAMIHESSLEGRVRHVLEPGIRRGPVRRAVLLGVAAAVAALSVSVAALQGAPVYQVDDPGVTPPRVVKEVRPSYPPEAMTARVEGSVTLRTVINASGEPVEIRVVQSLEESLDREAIKALAEWRFEPGRRDGKPVRVQVTVMMTFRIQ